MPIVKSTTPTIKIKQGITANYEKAIITLKNLKGDTIKKENPVNIDGIFEVNLSQTDTQTLGAGLVKFEIQYFYTDGTTNIEINGKIYMYDSFSDGKATATGGIDDEKIYTAELISDTLINTTRGIVDIKKTATSGLIDTYTITYTDDTTSTFEVTNGEKGDTGEQGIQGEQGVKGDTGATYELTDSDKEEIAEITQEDATSLFNQNVSEKTTTFEKLVSDSETEITDLATAKEQSLTDLSTTKENSLTSLATTLTGEFNTNATTKTNTFDSNAEEKTSDFNAVVTSANETIDGKVETVEGLAEDIDTAIVSYVGDTEDLTTNDKTNIVNPINEVNSLAKANKSELEKARESFLGTMYEDLYARLMADFSAVYDRFNEANLVPYSDTFINASNTYVGLTSGTEIKGVTVQDQYYIQTVEDRVIRFDDAVGEYAVVTSDVDCEVTRCGKNLSLYNDYEYGVNPTTSNVLTLANYLDSSKSYTLSLKGLSGTGQLNTRGVKDGNVTVNDFMLMSVGYENDITVSTTMTNVDSIAIYKTGTGYIDRIATDIQIETGTTATDYEPYNGSTYTLTANTPTQIPLLDGTNTFFCDTGDNLTVRYLTETETEETTPNADFPQEMSSVEGDLVVKSVGRNLIDPIKISSLSEGVERSLKWNEDLKIFEKKDFDTTSTVIGASSNSTPLYSLPVGNIPFTTSYRIKSSDNLFAKHAYVLNDGEPHRYGINSDIIVENPINITINANGHQNINKIGYIWYFDQPASSVNLQVSELMMTLGTQSHPYEPYTEDTTTYSDITLRSLPNGVCDKIKPLTGTITRNIGIRDYADGDYELSNIYTDGTNTLYQLDTPIIEEISTDKKEFRTYDGVTNILTTGTDVIPIISTNIPSNIGAVVADQSNTIASQSATITEQSSVIESLTNELSSVQEQSNDTDDVLNELIGGESV